MRARREARVDPEGLAVRVGAVAVALTVAGLAACSSPGEERHPASPAARRDLPASDAAVEDAEGAGAEALASVEAELAEYEARLAKVGVSVRRGQPAPGAASRPVDNLDDGAASTETVRPEAAPSPDVTTKKDSAGRPATGRPTKRKSPSRDARRKNERKPSKRARGKDGDFAPPPPAKGGARSQGNAQDSAVGGAVAAGDADASTALAEATEAEEEASRIDPKPRCEELCTLADAICALEERVCALADEHAWDQRYADACTRAGEDCVAATEACTTCRP